jgi:hypothetical protein
LLSFPRVAFAGVFILQENGRREMRPMRRP